MLLKSREQPIKHRGVENLFSDRFIFTVCWPFFSPFFGHFVIRNTHYRIIQDAVELPTATHSHVFQSMQHEATGLIFPS